MDFKVLEEKALKEGINEIEMYTLSHSGTSISLLNLDIDQNQIFDTTVINIRGVYNNHIVSVYVENISNDNIDNVVERLKRSAMVSEDSKPYFIYEGDKEYLKVSLKENDLDSLSQEEKINFLKDVVKKVQAESEFVTAVESSLEIEKEEISIQNSKGLSLVRKESVGYIVIGAVINKDNEVKNSYDIQLFENFKDYDLNKALDNSVREALRQVGASSIESKEYKVVLKNSCVRNLLQAFSAQFSAKAVIDKMSSLDSKLNEKIFGDNITLVDDPLANKFNVKTFDDEGVSTKKKNIVENGVLKTYFHNLQTAKMMNTNSTGNGFKASIRSGVGVLPANFFLKPGKKSLDELFEFVGDGIYITDFQGLHAGLDPISGNFNLQSKGYVIKNGKVDRPLTLIITSGNFFKMMNEVEEIGSNLEFFGSTGAPAIVVKSLSVSGK